MTGFNAIQANLRNYTERGMLAYLKICRKSVTNNKKIKKNVCVYTYIYLKTQI